ncbi:hypothetical protein Tco_0109415 [Tanacetum coccineum]
MPFTVTALSIIITSMVSFSVSWRNSLSCPDILYSLFLLSAASSLLMLLVTFVYLLSLLFLLLDYRFLLTDSILACRLLLADSCLTTLACRLLLADSCLWLSYLLLATDATTFLLANLLACCCVLVAFFSSPTVIKKLAACFRLSLPDYIRCNRPFLALHTSGMRPVALIPRVDSAPFNPKTQLRDTPIKTAIWVFNALYIKRKTEYFII